MKEEEDKAIKLLNDEYKKMERHKINKDKIVSGFKQALLNKAL
jgi:hypothetical protein